MRSYRNRRHARIGQNSGSFWLSFSDLMSCLLLIIILILFYIMYQYFDMYEINMAEIARQQYDLNQANVTLEAERTKLTEAEQQMMAQQIRLNAAEAELEDAESILATQQEELAAAQTLLATKEEEIATQKSELDTLGEQLTTQKAQLETQQTKLDEQQTKLDTQQTQLAQQQSKLDTQQTQLAQQQSKLDTQAQQITDQQAALDTQQAQIEQLIGMKTRIITSLSEALKQANISATVDPANGSIALESDVLFSTGEYTLTDRGRASIDSFLPIYLRVLLSDEYRPYVTEIIIEGHTDSDGTYIKNLRLSQDRAMAVAAYVLDDSYRGISGSQRAQLRSLVTANGRSFSDPVLNENGREDKDASRRVVFKFRLTDDQMIDQLKTILESE